METPPVVSYLPPGQDPFAAGERTPDVVAYVRGYCALASLTCGAGIVGLVVTAARSFDPSTNHSDAWAALTLCVIVALGLLAVGIAYVFGAIAPRRPWMYGFGIALLVGSMLFVSCCFPFSIVLLVQWTKPEVKAWFQGPSTARPTNPLG
ncbi:MAG: hypothetical protein MUF34_11235 [Polyangiaceae bacterium]|nr:hypothetical protein [Polyangiaceae bacterium]